MSETETPEIDTAATSQETPEQAARLADAVAGIAGIVPHAPEGLLAPRLRSPFFAGCIGLALAAHAAGIGAYLWWRLDEGFAGRYPQAAGITAIDTEIIDGQEWLNIGGRTEEASPGAPTPLAPSAIDQSPSVAQPRSAPAREQTETQSPSPASPTTPVLSTDSPDDAQVMAAIPPPPFQVDTSIPPVVEPAQEPAPAKAEQPAAQITAAVPADAAPAQEPSQASQGGEGGQVQALTEMAANGGAPAATPGQIKTYHARLGAHIRTHRPISRGRLGKVVVRFGLDSDGVLRFADILQSSGNAQLEEKTLTAMHKASPYPRPPAGLYGKQLEFTVPFTFQR